MRYRAAVVVFTCCLLWAAGCTQPTPPGVLDQYNRLNASLDRDRIGDSIATLKTFRQENRRFAIVRLVDSDIKELLASVEGRAHEARELARSGDIGRAEAMLRDLATNFSATADGRLATEYLAFDFPMLKVNRLALSGDFAEAEVVLNDLTERKLEPDQRAQVERMLDQIGNARLADQQAEQQRAANAARMLRVALMAYHAENGTFPATFDLGTFDFGQSEMNADIRDNLDAVEIYQGTKDVFSCVAVSKGRSYSFLIDQTGVEPR